MNRSQYLHVVLFLSGIAGLGYEILWVRMFAVGLGHEVPSMLAVIAAFFAGLALGAWALDRRVSRSARPDRWYAGLELVIGLWALLSIAAIPLANRWLPAWTGAAPGPVRLWLVAFAAPFVVLLPATVCMGATLPAMDRLLRRRRGVAALYAANTFGAVIGTLGVTFWLAPRVGYRLSLLGLALLNLLCAAAVLRVPRVDPSASADGGDGRNLRAILFVTGVLGIGYEVVGVRVMAQVLENTVYSFASALAIYLLATAVGAAVYQRLPPERSFEARLGNLLSLVSAACFVGILVLSRSREIHQAVRGLGSGFAEVVLAAAVFFPPAALMGATFSHLAQGARGPEGGVGRALSLNTLGGALAPVLLGVLALPALGAKWTLIGIGAAYLALQPRGAGRRLVAPAVALLMLLVIPANLQLVRPAPGGTLLAFRQGAMAAVAVAADEAGRRSLKVNDHFSMGGEASVFAETRQALVPLLLHPRPSRALFLGLGTGITFAVAGRYPGLEADAVELVPGVIAMAPWFERVTGPLAANPALNVFTADARRFVRATPRSYDVIIADLFHPARDGSGNLYTREHFAAVRARLREGGLFCQWLPLHQLEPRLLRVIIRTFLDVFPEAEAYLSHVNVETPALALVGSVNAIDRSGPWLASRETSLALLQELDDAEFYSDLDLFGLRLATAEQLVEFAGSGALNTDDRPIVVFEAPGILFRGATYETLPAVIDAVGSSSGVSPLERFRNARDIYLRAELRRIQGDFDGAIEGYVASAAASEDFTLGYAAGLQLANSLPLREARTLLRALSQASPGRDEAPEALGRLDR